MNINICTILSISVAEFNTRPAVYNSSRSHHTLSLRISGENTLTADGTSYISNAGTVTFVPAGQKYTHHVHTASKTIVVSFTTRENIGNAIEVFHSFPDHNEEALFRELLIRWSMFPHNNSVRCMVIFYEILDNIRRIAKSWQTNPRSKLIESAVSLMYKRYNDSGFLIQELSENAHVSEAYFRRLFEKKYGCPPSVFLKRLRINHAKTLLASSFYTVEEIAELSGFASISYFCYAFKQSTGQTPTEFARSSTGNIN